MNTWIRAKLHKIVKEEIGDGKKIAVCPYGEWGMVLADILEKAYGINDIVILDNGLSKYNSAIYAVEDLKEMDTRNMTIILTSISHRNSEEIKKQIEGLNISVSVRNILETEILNSPQKDLYFQKLKEILSCKKVRGKDFVRIGGDQGDGGYVMVDDFDDNMRAYSFGIGNNVTWDMDIANRNIEVFMYDHTILCLPQVHKRFHFNKTGVGSGEKCSSLSDILEKNGDINNCNLICKMDIEGAEWDILYHMKSEILNRFRQISLELHGVCNMENREIILAVLSKINLTHQIVWLHGNNADKAEVSNGILIPNLLEVNYIRKDNYSFYDGICEFPMALDLPNLMYRHDFELGNWGE